MKLAIIASAAAIAVYAGATAATTRSEPLFPNGIPAAAHSQSSLRADMRKAWAKHTIYTHQYIVSAIGGLPDATVIVTRLVENQEQIGSMVGKFYGKAAGDKVTMLLKQHISQAADLVKALKVGDKAGMDLLGKQWHENADAIADMLSKANPGWKKSDLLADGIAKQFPSKVTADIKQ